MRIAEHSTSPCFPASILQEGKRLVVPAIELQRVAFQLAILQKRHKLAASLSPDEDNLNCTLQTMLKWTRSRKVVFEGVPEQLSPLVNSNPKKDSKSPSKKSTGTVIINQSMADFFRPSAQTTQYQSSDILAVGLVFPIPDVESYAFVLGTYFTNKEQDDGSSETPSAKPQTVAWVVPMGLLHENPSFSLPKSHYLKKLLLSNELPSQKAVLLLKSDKLDLIKLQNFQLGDSEFVAYLGEQSFLESYAEQPFIHPEGSRTQAFLFPSPMQLVSLAFQFEQTLSAHSGCDLVRERGFSERLSESLTRLARFYQVNPTYISQWKKLKARTIQAEPQGSFNQVANLLLEAWGDEIGRMSVRMSHLIPLSRKLSEELSAGKEAEETREAGTTTTADELACLSLSAPLTRITRLNTSLKRFDYEQTKDNQLTEPLLDFVIQRDTLTFPETATLGQIRKIDTEETHTGVLPESDLVLNPHFSSLAEAKEKVTILNELDGSNDKYTAWLKPSVVPEELTNFLDKPTKATHGILNTNLHNLSNELVEAPFFVILDEFSSYFSPFSLNPSSEIQPLSTPLHDDENK